MPQGSESTSSDPKSDDRGTANTPPVVIACAAADFATIWKVGQDLRNRGHIVELVNGAEDDPEALAEAVRKLACQGLYVLCRSKNLERKDIDDLREVLRNHEVPFGRTLTLAIEQRSARAIEDRIVSVLRRMVTGRGEDKGKKSRATGFTTTGVRPTEELDEDAATKLSDSELRKQVLPTSVLPPPRGRTPPPIPAAGMPGRVSIGTQKGPPPLPPRPRASTPARQAQQHYEFSIEEREPPESAIERTEIAAVAPLTKTAPQPVVSSQLPAAVSAPMPAASPSMISSHSLPPSPSVQPNPFTASMAASGTQPETSVRERIKRGRFSRLLAGPGLWLVLGLTGAVMIVLGGLILLAGDEPVKAANGSSSSERGDRVAHTNAAGVEVKPVQSDAKAPAGEPKKLGPAEPAKAVAGSPPLAADASKAPPQQPPATKPENSPDAEEKKAAPLDAADVAEALRSRKVRALDTLLVAMDPSRRTTYARAGRYCGSLKVAGLEGWRLPTVGELYSLTAAKVVRRGVYWSDTVGDVHGDRRMVVNAKKRKIVPSNLSWKGSRALCVRERS